MKIYKYSFRNIGPFSNIPTVIDFEKPNAEMNMLIGKNGIGKSTTIKVLKFGLYHELAYAGDIKVDEIANDVNKNGEIEIELNSRGKDWTITTNFSPNKIKVYEGRGDSRSAEPLDKGGMPETKRYIRDQILDIPFYIFDNILSIDVSEFKSLLTLNADDTRKIRDRIFGFSVFNEMSADIKKRMNALVEERKLMEHDMDGMKQQHIKLLADIENMKEQVKSGLKVDELKEKIVQAKKDKEAKSAKYESLSVELVQANNDYRFYQNKKNTVTIATMTAEKLVIEKFIKENIDKQAEIDKQIQALQEYSEVTALSKTVTEDKEKFNKQNNDLKQITADYNKLAEELKTASVHQAVVSDHIKKKSLEKLHIEYLGLLKQNKEDHDRHKEIEKETERITTENNELQVQAISYKKELEAHKNGVCHECNTKFDTQSPDHAKYIEELQKKKTACEIKYDNNQSKAVKLITELQEQARRSSDRSFRLASIKSEFTRDDLDPSDAKLTWETGYSGSDAEADLKTVNSTIADIKAKASKLKDDSTMLRGQLTSFREQIMKNSERLKELEIKFKDKPTGNIEALKELRASMVTKRNELHKQENSLDVQVQVLNTKIHPNVKEAKGTEQEADIKLGELPQAINEVKAELDKFDKEIFEYEKSIEIANNAANLNLQSVHIKKQAKEVESAIKAQVAKLGETKIKIERQEHLLEVIKRSKDEVLRVNIPYINHMVVNTCKRIGVTQMLTFDDSFVPHIQRGNREVSLMSASLGQRKKMNFAVLISITKFLKLRYGGLNIIFYDEMFSSIDEEGRPHMLEIIRQEIVENLGIHVWLTNHFFIPNSQFDNYIIVESKSGFSAARMIGAGELLSLPQYTEKQAITA